MLPQKNYHLIVAVSVYIGYENVLNLEIFFADKGCLSAWIDDFKFLFSKLYWSPTIIYIYLFIIPANPRRNIIISRKNKNNANSYRYS